MEKELATGQLGTVGGYGLALHGAQIAFTLQAGIPVGSAEVVVKIEMEEVLKLIAEKIPGQIDDAVFALIISSLKA
jgi:hypothetical protein